MTENQRARTDVLYALFQAEFLGLEPPSRSAIQSVLYLSAMLASLQHIAWGYTFSNAPYGPFNRNVGIAADELAVQKLAEPLRTRLSHSDRVRSSYSITKSGRELTAKLMGLNAERARCFWIGIVAKGLRPYDWPIVNKIARREPTYESMRHANQHGMIPMADDENLSLELIAAIYQELRLHLPRIAANSEAQIITFFDFVSSDIGASA